MSDREETPEIPPETEVPPEPEDPNETYIIIKVPQFDENGNLIGWTDVRITTDQYKAIMDIINGS